MPLCVKSNCDSENNPSNRYQWEERYCHAPIISLVIYKTNCPYDAQSDSVAVRWRQTEAGGEGYRDEHWEVHTEKLDLPAGRSVTICGAGRKPGASGAGSARNVEVGGLGAVQCCPGMSQPASIGRTLRFRLEHSALFLSFLFRLLEINEGSIEIVVTEKSLKFSNVNP